MRTRRTLIAALLVCSLPASAQLLTDRGPPQHRIVQRNTLAARINPLGFIYDGRFAYRYRLYASDSVALRDNFVSLGITPGASPAFARIGLIAEVQPATVLGFSASYEWMQYFGTFNLFQSFPGASADFSDRAIKARGDLPLGDPLRWYVKGGAMLTVGANLNLKFGPIVVRNQFRIYRPDFVLRSGDTTLYDQVTDLLMPNRRLTLFNDLDVLYQTNFGLLAGVRYNLGVPLYGEENGPAKDNSTHRVGPFFAYRFFDHDGARFNQPTLALVVNWWVKHPYRAGTESSAAIPYVALAFNCVGDLLPLASAPQPESSPAAAPD